MAADSALEVALHLAETFEAAGIDYLVGGSLASSLHGEPRSTQDVDFVADLKPHHVDAWLRRLGDGYYLDRDRIEQAIQKRRSFNVIHLGTLFKADVFVLGDDPANRREMERRELYEVGDGRRLWVASAEDVVLQKLMLGNAVSDRQWRDVLSVLAVRRGSLDEGYLQEMAVELGLEELLERARHDADV